MVRLRGTAVLYMTENGKITNVTAMAFTNGMSVDVTQYEAMDIALAAGGRYQLAKIILVHKERLMKFMKHFARVPSSNKIVEKKFVRIGEASMTYSIGHHRFIEMARAAGAVYKIGTAKGNTILINLEIFDDYMEQFREPPTEMKHPLPNVKGD